MSEASSSSEPFLPEDKPSTSKQPLKQPPPPIQIQTPSSPKPSSSGIGIGGGGGGMDNATRLVSNMHCFLSLIFIRMKYFSLISLH